MTRRQTMPQRWLIADARIGEEVWRALQRLPRGSGVLAIRALSAAEERRLRKAARLQELTVVQEGVRTAARVHDMRELRQALARRVPIILISPVHSTRSHPDWQPLPRMRAATLARLAKRQAIALGGMNQRRYAKVAQLGFIGWAGIDAFRT